LPADKKKDYLFRTCPSDSLQGVISGMLDAGMYRTASVMYVDNPYGQGIAGQFKKTFEELGGNVLTMVAHDEKPAKSYSTELKSALAKFYLPKPTLQGKPGDYVDSLVLPEVLCVFSYTGQANIYVKEAIESFKYKSFLFCDGSKSEDLIKAVGAQNLEGLMGTSPASGVGEPYMLFNVYYHTEFGKLPPQLPFISNAYDATAVIGLAAYAAKAKGLPLTGKNIRDQLRLVANPPGEFIKPGEFKRAFELLDQGKEINYEGASGSVDFDQNGDVAAPIEVWKYSGGKIVTFRIEYYIAEK
jgi:ABC-type branched-subunit amino acid transport system substrate-binding protein